MRDGKREDSRDPQKGNPIQKNFRNPQIRLLEQQQLNSQGVRDGGMAKKRVGPSERKGRAQREARGEREIR